MSRPASVRVRGIYTTALTALLLEQGHTIVDASAVIQRRFGLPHWDTPEDVNIVDRRYVDLELDVVRLPDGTSRLEDTGVLVDKLARGRLPPALGQEAIRINGG